MWEILLNSVLNGWLKLLIIILARKWVVLLTNYKWAICSLPIYSWAIYWTLPIKKWVVHSYKSQMVYMFSATHLWAY